MGRMGYDGIAVWGGRPHMYRQDLHAQLREILDLLAEYGMEVCHVVPAQFRYPSLLSSTNERVRRDSVRYIMDNADNALLLGAPSIHVCAGFSSFDEPRGAGLGLPAPEHLRDPGVRARAQACASTSSRLTASSRTRC